VLLQLRLQKFLAEAGVGSRRYCEKLISQGRVRVNGQIVTKLGTKVDPECDLVELDSKVIKLEKDLVFILLNKPKGVLTTVKDEFSRPTVMQLISIEGVRLYPVGRLDKDTEGLLLLTNDGKLAHRLTHPRFKVKKVYYVEVAGKLAKKSLGQLEKGVRLADGITAPAKVEVIKFGGDKTLLKITIREGRKRQIKRMFRALGYQVLYLKRIAFGPLKLGSLSSGEWRYLTSQEVEKLRKAVGLEINI
jgi:pseudouridine synthase